MDESTQLPGKRCIRCNLVLPLTEFARQARSTTTGRIYGFRGNCRDCQSIYAREHYRERREFIDAYKMERGCLECGYCEHPAALEFDHLPGFKKVADISQFRLRGSHDELLAELAKCEVVCANCHRVRTMTRGDSSNSRKSDLRRGEVKVSLSSMFTDVDQLAIDLDAIA